MIRRIVVLLSGTPCDENSALAAVMLAKRLGAVVEGLSIKIDPSELMFRLGEGVAASAIDEILAAAERSSEEAAARGRATLEAAAKRLGLAFTGSSAGPAGVSARIVQGPAIDVLTTEVGLADLVVFGEPGERAPIDLLPKIEHTLMHLRRPILIARGRVGANFGDNIIAAFNGTVESCAVLSRAIDILARAKSVELLHLAESDEDQGGAERALRYITLHGGRAVVREQAPSGRGIGEDIAARAVTTGADLIIMGGYGRSRLRELVLGGATRHLMAHAPVPVLMAH